MNSPLSQKIFLLVSGDVLVLYASLLLTLIIRYETTWQEALSVHLGPFSFVFTVWIVVFYIAGLYDFRKITNNLTFLTLFSISLTLNTLITTALFYLIPAFGIAPRANLSLLLIIFAVLQISWRRIFWYYLKQNHNLFRVVMIGNDPTIDELSHALAENPQIGYQVVDHIHNPHDLHATDNIAQKLQTHKADVVVIPRGIKQNTELQKIFYGLLSSGIAIYDVPAFYEEVFRKIPLKHIEESWFLEHISIRKNVYDDLKRLSEVVTASLIGLLLLPLIILISLLIRLSSRGPVIFSQRRIGAQNKLFTLYKFRTMVQDAEKDGAKWASENDPRVTLFGKILRHSHLDELPQIWNIIRGDLSFVGPRPERPEFVEILEKEIPHYDIRHLIKPGVTGWAQINYRYGSSIEDSYQKLQYDIYYLKNRSLILDFAIILKTLRTLFVNEK